MTKIIETIVFRCVEYPLLYVTLDDGTDVPVSDTALQDALLDAEGNYVSDEARVVDEQISCYMDNLENAAEEDVQAFVEECYAE